MTLFFKAIYKDHSSFIFSLENVGGNDYSKIDRTKLIRMEVYDDAKPLHVLHIEEGQRLILRTRVLTTLNKRQIMESEESEIALESFKQQRLIIIGYQETIQGQNRQAITIIFPDGHTEMISQWKEAPLNAVQLTESEMKH